MIRKMLDLSTNHVSPAARLWLEAQSWAAVTKGESTMVVARHNSGWLVYASAEPAGSLHDDLYDACVEARRQDCEFLYFDADGEELETLKLYGEADDDSGKGWTDEEMAVMNAIVAEADAADGPSIPILDDAGRLVDDEGGLHDELDEAPKDDALGNEVPADLDDEDRENWLAEAADKLARRKKPVEDALRGPWPGLNLGDGVAHGGKIEDYIAAEVEKPNENEFEIEAFLPGTRHQSRSGFLGILKMERKGGKLEATPVRDAETEGALQKAKIFNQYLAELNKPGGDGFAGVVPLGAPIHFTQSGRQKLDKAGHAVVGRSALNELIAAAKALLEMQPSESPAWSVTDNEFKDAKKRLAKAVDAVDGT